MSSPGQSVVVLGSPSNEGTEALVEEWRAAGIDAELVSPADALDRVHPGDIVVARLDVVPTLDGVEPGLLALLLLERRGANVVNTAGALLDVHDKLRTARRLGAARIPHPATQLVADGTPITLRPPLVLKPRFGSWGRDVFLCPDDDEVQRCLEAVRERPWFRRHGALVQELIPPAGHDTRVVVARGRVIGTARREAAAGEWRTNVSLGGRTLPVAADDEVAELARAAAAAVDIDFVGVDVLTRPDGGHVVVELNGAVEFDESYASALGNPFREAARALGLGLLSVAA